MVSLPSKKSKKKVDHGALMSPFMRIPRFDIRAARLLLDLGFKEIYDLVGRSPETLWEEATRKKLTEDTTLRPHLRMAVYFAENQPPERNRLHPHLWAD